MFHTANRNHYEKSLDFKALPVVKECRYVTVREVVKQTDANVNKRKCYVDRVAIIQQYMPINNLCINLFLSVFSLKRTSMIYLV